MLGIDCALRLDVKCQRLWERFWTNRKQKTAEISQEILLYVPFCGMVRVRSERKAADYELKHFCKGKQQKHIFFLFGSRSEVHTNILLIMLL